MKLALPFVVLAALLACADDSVDRTPTISAIRVAVLPDQSKDTLLTQHRILLDYLESETSLEFELTVPSDYAELVEQFDTGDIDLAWFGGLTFTQAERRSQAEPLALRDVDLQFTSCYLANASDARMSVAEFAGEDFGFGPELSTSGHLMPRYFMTDGGLSPETYFGSIRHSSGHDQTAKWVADGTVTFGVANCIVVQTLFDNGGLNRDDIRIVETTPPYADYVWAVRASLDEDIKLTLLDAFLALDASNPEHRNILRTQGANAYLPAAREDFALVRLAANRAGLLAIEDKN